MTSRPGRAATFVALILASLPAYAVLQGRDLDGNATTFEAFYDTALDITWLADFGLSGGNLSWKSAGTWAAGLSWHGISGWRLPTVLPAHGSALIEVGSNNGSTDFGYAKTGAGWGTANELGHLFYVTLAGSGRCKPNDASPTSCVTQTPHGLTGDVAPFFGIAAGDYWTGTALPSNPSSRALAFNFALGLQGQGGVGTLANAVAVRDGDVSAVPEPGAAAMLLAGLAGLAMRHPRRARSER